MRLLLGNAKARQQVNDCLRLDLKLSGEFVNTDLGCVTHTFVKNFSLPAVPPLDDLPRIQPP